MSNIYEEFKNLYGEDLAEQKKEELEKLQQLNEKNMNGDYN